MYKSIKAFLYDRTSSPLFGAFIISWSIINYRVILTIFSGESLANKFEVINTLFQPIDTGFFFVSAALVHGFIYPVIATLLYIYLYPRLAKPVYKHSLKKQIELREIKQEEESNRLLTLEESREIYKEMAEVENRYNQQEEIHRKQVAGLISEVEKLGDIKPPTRVRAGTDSLQQGRKEGAKRQSGTPESKINKLPADLESVLMVFSGSSVDEKIDINYLFDAFKDYPFNDIDLLRYGADELVNQGFLENVMGSYFLTHKGRSYMIEHLRPNE